MSLSEYDYTILQHLKDARESRGLNQDQIKRFDNRIATVQARSWVDTGTLVEVTDLDGITEPGVTLGYTCPISSTRKSVGGSCPDIIYLPSPIQDGGAFRVRIHNITPIKGTL